MSWRIRVDGVDASSDDLSLDEVATLETLAGQPWSLCNPLKSIPMARALLVVVLQRDGRSDEQVEKILTGLTLRQLRDAFDWVTDEDDGPATESEDPVPLARRGSGSGGKPDIYVAG